ncbi:MAG: hypothetical protein V1789_01860 [PVC group bacterium]
MAGFESRGRSFQAADLADFESFLGTGFKCPLTVNRFVYEFLLILGRMVIVTHCCLWKSAKVVHDAPLSI